MTEQHTTSSKLDDVIGLQIVGQLNEAFLKLAELAQSDPDVLLSTVGANLAMTLTDLPRDQAIAAVLAASQNVKVVRRVIQPAKGRAIDLIDVVLELAVLLVMLIFISAITRAGAIPLANRLLANLKGVAGQYNANSANSLAASMAQLTNGQSINPAALAQLEAQMRQGQFSANSPEFRATIIAGLLSNLSHTQLTNPSTKTIALDALKSGLYLFFVTVATTLAIFVLGRALRGKSGVVRFFHYMTRAYLIINGMIFVGLSLWFIVLSLPTMPATLQSALFVVGLLLLMASALYGLRLQITATTQAHRFGRIRGFVVVTIGGLGVTLLFGLSTLNFVLPAIR